jgi:hypothetical protein
LKDHCKHSWSCSNHKLSISRLSNGNYVKNCSFRIHMFYTLISYIENTFETWIYRKMWNLCDIHSFIGLYFIHQHIYMCVKCVFNALYLCVQCMNLWINELCTIFIINSLYVKFVISWSCFAPNSVVLFYVLCFVSKGRGMWALYSCFKK